MAFTELTTGSCKRAFRPPQDSPLFRSRVRELEGNVDALRDRASRLIKGAKKYKDGLEDAFQCTLAFANCLEVGGCCHQGGLWQREEEGRLGAGG